jgi:pyruvate dehydrogenase E2 component (dihydrolipoamide acetyltransferase)
VATVETILLPDVGDFADVEIIEILVAPGDRIIAEQPMLSLESDKATMEVPAPRAGVVKELLVKLGDKVSSGRPLLTLETEGESTAPAAPAAKPAPAAAAPVTAAAAAPATAPARAGAAETLSVVLPDIGDYTDVPVIEVLVKPGDQIAVDQSLVTLETDKATMEVPSPYAGLVESVAVKVGDKLTQGDLILTLRGEAAATPNVETPASQPTPAAPAARAPGEPEPRPAPVPARPEDLALTGAKPHASPGIRRFARELGVDLRLVTGSGPKARILREDVQGYVKGALAVGASPLAAAAAPAAGALPFGLTAAAEVDFAKFGPVEVQELQRIKKLSGRHLHRCWLSIPHVTQFEDADITDLEDFRKAQKDAAEQAGVRLSILPLLLKVAAVALNQMPKVKSSLSTDGESLILKQYTHIGVAVDTPGGLVVPVVRDVDKKGIFDLARELGDLGKKARDGKLLPTDMQGGCFTISSLGGIGGTHFTPIVNAPEVAILGVSRADLKPVWNGSEFRPRLMLPLSLSYDHRVIDGAEGARFTTLLCHLLADIRRLLL